jgi:RNA polymerase sigma factor (sigma-70 family)
MTPSLEDAGSDQRLIELALEGDRGALRALVTRHQPFVFNVAMKMFGNREDAEDLTQEVLTRVITSLRTFRGESAFSTWLYRITVNHFLKTRRRGLEVEVERFESYFEAVEAMPDAQLDDADVQIADSTVEELRVRCTTGMLMCLDREQRITFILGAIFNVNHLVGGEVMGVSPGNFRVRLHRARGDLYQWMNRRCGLVNTENPCRCHKKARGFVQRGLVDPRRLTFNADYKDRVETLSHSGAREVMSTLEDLHERVFLTHPAQVSRSRVVDEILGNEAVRRFFDLS